MARILIVDDANFMRVTLANILTNAHHEVVGEAENGLEAVDKYKQLQPDLVIMDITMPLMNGIDAIAKIKEYHQDATILVCSAMGQQKIVVNAIEAGAKDFIVKPFDDNRVVETVSRILQQTIS